MEISPTSSHKNAVFVSKNMAASSVTLTNVETQFGILWVVAWTPLNTVCELEQQQGRLILQ